MKLEQFYQLKDKLEIKPFQSSFSTLKTVLYYFSFLGNLFLILFGFFFIKNVTDAIPQLFPYQSTFFAIFVALFLTGYELFKRYALEQFVVTILKNKKISVLSFFGFVVCLGLIAGSFYLSLNGAHRLIDNADRIESTVDATVSAETDSISAIYNKKITVVEKRLETKQAALDKVLMGSDSLGNYNYQQRKSIKQFEKDITELNSQIAAIELERDNKVTKADSSLTTKLSAKAEKQLDKNAENDLAFVFMTFFLEFIILAGVGFHGYYTIGSYMETKKLLQTPLYSKLDKQYLMLEYLYGFGNKKKNNEVISQENLMYQMLEYKHQVSKDEINKFYQKCNELEIIKDGKYYITFNKAKQIIESQKVR